MRDWKRNPEGDLTARRQLRFSCDGQVRCMVKLPSGHSVKTVRNSVCCIVVLFSLSAAFLDTLGLYSAVWLLHCTWSHCARERCSQYPLTGDRS